MPSGFEIDCGRYAVTKKESDKYVFKVPVLRNVEKTSPCFHDGSVDKLEEAVMIMGKIQLDRELPEYEIGEIVSFPASLTGEIRHMPSKYLCCRQLNDMSTGSVTVRGQSLYKPILTR